MIVALGLDLSLTSTGVAADGWATRWRPSRTGVERLAWYRTRLRNLLEDTRDTAALHAPCPIVAAIEGYSYGSETHAHALGEWGGVARLVLRDYRVPVVVIPPKSVKKYATGSGNADKDAVLAAAVRLGAPVNAHDEADAWWLRAMTLDHYGEPVVEMPAKNRTALTAIVPAKKGRPAHPAIAWPDLAAAA